MILMNTTRVSETISTHRVTYTNMLPRPIKTNKTLTTMVNRPRIMNNRYVRHGNNIHGVHMNMSRNMRVPNFRLNNNLNRPLHRHNEKRKARPNILRVGNGKRLRHFPTRHNPRNIRLHFNLPKNSNTNMMMTTRQSTTHHTNDVVTLRLQIKMKLTISTTRGPRRRTISNTEALRHIPICTTLPS